MRQSPRRPLILKRRKLPFPESETEAARDVPDGARRQAAPPAPAERGLPDALRIVDHPSMPDTQVVVVPQSADLQSVIDSLSARGKERGSPGAQQVHPAERRERKPGGLARLSRPVLLGRGRRRKGFREPAHPSTQSQSRAQNGPPVEAKPLSSATFLAGGCARDGLGSGAGGRASEKENQEPCAQRLQLSQHLDGAQRPPYSYMAMIQFAINSKPDRRMTLKEIYTWIEDHFPYFRNVAKPGWKNSIRHNLSLHDMFTGRRPGREDLLLDHPSRGQPLPDPGSGLQATKASCSPNQESGHPNQLGEEDEAPSFSTESYLVPIQLSLSPSLFLPSAAPLAAPPELQLVGGRVPGGGKKVRIAPKSGQRLPPSSTWPRPREEPVLLFPDNTFFDGPDLRPLRLSGHGAGQPGRACAFKTPIKGSRPASSTPSKPIGRERRRLLLLLPALALEDQPRVTDARHVLDFSPIRGPLGPSLTPQNQNRTPFGRPTPPPSGAAPFQLPRELLTSSVRRSPASWGRRPGQLLLTEGLVLDTMNDSLSKIWWTSASRAWRTGAGRLQPQLVTPHPIAQPLSKRHAVPSETCKYFHTTARPKACLQPNELTRVARWLSNRWADHAGSPQMEALLT
ncbi:hypothetical protein ANANG_G00312060 [Anguilla anguilla]|uniref:Fork-head domain-containing protein n=1 Tax=Anguilla anguilla TaxID=7936 RepID=A0A9D3RI12_ANGAN|nr:hypothetical protein ANANG_G00312060 [Anguilla anguilla]